VGVLEGQDFFVVERRLHQYVETSLVGDFEGYPALAIPPRILIYSFSVVARLRPCGQGRGYYESTG
jgi:hypothetical protein